MTEDICLIRQAEIPLNHKIYTEKKAFLKGTLSERPVFVEIDFVKVIIRGVFCDILPREY